MMIEILENKEAVAARAAELVSEAGRLPVSDGDGVCNIALAGGTTPKVLYTMLAAEPFATTLPWQHLHWFFGDERFVPSDHGESNFRIVKETLFDPAGVPEGNIFRVRTELGDPEQVAADYQEQVKLQVEADGSGVPIFDLVLLGMGADGHTASLFPHTSALAEYEKLVAPNFVPAMDTWRITLTAPVLMAARQVVVLVTGDEKAPALASVLEGEENVNTYPAQLLRGRNTETTWLVDRAAAAELKTRS